MSNILKRAIENKLAEFAENHRRVWTIQKHSNAVLMILFTKCENVKIIKQLWGKIAQKPAI